MSTLRIRISQYLADRRAKRQEDQGAGLVEYAAVLVLVAAIATAVFASGIHERPAKWMKAQMDNIANAAGEMSEEEDEN